MSLWPSAARHPHLTTSKLCAANVMIYCRRLYCLLLLSSILFAQAAAQHAGHHGEDRPGSDQDLLLGTIHFPTSGSPGAQAEFIRGALALHSFWYPQAREHFRSARAIDPGFAMAYWGEAMSLDHPLWIELDTTAGRAVLAELDARIAAGEVKWTPREQSYVDAVRTVFMERPPETHRAAYSDAMQRLSEEYPEDDEAAVFAALARMTVPGFDFESSEDLVSVAAALEEVYQRNPEHPGAVHYLIHVYDSPTFAQMGLRPARAYARIAPASSHAIHMPSHIFRELGMWDEMASSNERAYEASIEWQEQTGRPLSDRDYHSFAWLFDAYLKLGRFADAERLFGDFHEIESEAERRKESTQRLVLGRIGLQLQYRQASAFAGLPEPPLTVPENLDVSEVPAYLLSTVAELAALADEEALYDHAVERIRSVIALPAYADVRNATEGVLGAFEAVRLEREGSIGAAIEAARNAMAAETREKETDLGLGAVKLAELLLDHGQPEEAREVFERLYSRHARNPRFVLGIARANVALGDPTAAARWYDTLSDIWSNADPDLPALVEAQRFVAQIEDR